MTWIDLARAIVLRVVEWIMVMLEIHIRTINDPLQHTPLIKINKAEEMNYVGVDMSVGTPESKLFKAF